MSSKKESPYYAYYLKSQGISGVVRSWEDCEKIIKGQVSPSYKKFARHRDALEFLLELVPSKEEPLLKEALYFDSGTGRGVGIEVSVTNSKKESQLFHLEPLGYLENALTDVGSYVLPVKEGYTNNFGELLGLFFALKIASLQNISLIYGDSELVLKYWSQGRWNSEKLPQRTTNLAKEVTEERKLFEKKGGKILAISGDKNPADLGFHR